MGPPPIYTYISNFNVHPQVHVRSNVVHGVTKIVNDFSTNTNLFLKNVILKISTSRPHTKYSMKTHTPKIVSLTPWFKPLIICWVDVSPELTSSTFLNIMTIVDEMSGYLPLQTQTCHPTLLIKTNCEYFGFDVQRLKVDCTGTSWIHLWCSRIKEPCKER
jgi:hypothetical protein